MPRTIRKRQLRNKKSRKQRGGVDQAQIDKIKKIQKQIDDSIKELLSVLGESDPKKDTVIDEVTSPLHNNGAVVNNGTVVNDRAVVNNGTVVNDRAVVNDVTSEVVKTNKNTSNA